MRCPDCGTVMENMRVRVSRQRSAPGCYCPECGAGYFTKNGQLVVVEESMIPEGDIVSFIESRRGLDLLGPYF